MAGGALVARMPVLLLLAALALTAAPCAAYLPGVGPKEYNKGDSLPLYVNELTSTRTQYPIDYYSIPFCAPERGTIKMGKESLGGQLEGDLMESSLYELLVGFGSTCKILCEKELSSSDAWHFRNAIDQEYLVHMTADSLPIASNIKFSGGDGETLEYFQQGFPVGYVGSDGLHYINNHLRIEVGYRPTSSGNHIVGFLVDPISFDHARAPLECAKGLDANSPGTADFPQQVEGPVTIKFTYDVFWEESSIPWTHRWDIYMSASVGDSIHWYSIINSSLIVLFLSALVAMILVRALRQDIQRYNAADIEDAKEESGWKLVHGDVFRPPMTMPTLFAVCVGTGMQLLTVAGLVLVFAMMGLISPARRGDMLTACMLIFVLMGPVCGYHTARVHKMFRGTSWLKVTTLAATVFPGFCFAIFSTINMALVFVGSSAAVSFAPLLKLLMLWLLVQAPLVVAGSYYGFKIEPRTQPVRTNQIPRQIPPQPWFLSPYVSIPFSGVLPFGAVSVELFFVMTAVWLQQVYYIFGFLLLVLIILILTCAEIAIVLCYFQLCAEDHRWWWRSLQWSGSFSGYMFLYSVWYYHDKLDMTGFVPALLYFGYSGLFSAMFALLTCAIGYYSCYWFTRKIYGSIKVD